MENILYFSKKNNYKNVWCQTEDEIVAWGEGEDLVAIKPDFESYIIATYNVTSTTSTTQLLGSSFTLSQISEMYIDNVKLDNVVNTYMFDTEGEHTVKMCAKCVTNCGNMFDYCYDLTSLDLSNFNTSNVTDMSAMFSDCHSLTSLDLSSFDTSKVTDMCYMFGYCRSLTSINFGDKFDTSNVTYMYSMFSSCGGLILLDLSSFDTSKVKNMDNMFDYCSGLTSLDLSNFNTSNVTNMNYMFNNCSGLTSITMVGDVSNVMSYGYMFNNCPKLTNINYNGNYQTKWDTFCPKCVNKIDIVTPTTVRCNYWDRLHNEYVTCDYHKRYNMVLENGCRAEYDEENNQYVFTFIAEKDKIKYDVYVDGIKEDYIKITNDLDIVLINAQSIIYEEVSASSTSSSYSLIYSSFTQYIDAMFIDGVETTIASIKTFSNTSCTRDIKIAFCNTSELTSMHNMFSGCTSLTSLDLSSFDTSNVTDMGHMFNICYNLTSLNLSSFDTSNVTDMGDMFGYCYRLKSLDLSSFDTSKVTDMNQMFQGCSGLTSLDLNSFDTSKVTSMHAMFNYCSGLTSLDFDDNFDTSNVTDMSFMFRGCSGLTSLDFGDNFDTSNVTDMEEMFYNCINLTSITFGNKFITSNVTDMTNMFGNCKSLISLDLRLFNTSKVTNMRYMFCHCESLTELNLSSFDTSKVTDMYYMFGYCYNLTLLDISSFDTSKVTTMYSMFESCSGLTELNLSSFDISNVTSYYNMFYNLPSSGTLTYPCAYSDAWDNLLVTNSGSTRLPSGWAKECVTDDGNDNSSSETIPSYTIDDANIIMTISASSTSSSYKLIVSSYIKYIDAMFIDGEQVEISSEKKFNSVGKHTVQMIMDTSNVTDMGSMFGYCSGLTSINFGDSFDTSNVTDMRDMFNGCKSLTSINFGDSFDTSNVTDMFCMFLNCYKLTSINFGDSFDTSNVTNIGSMFGYCRSLTSLDLTHFNTSNVTYMGDMFEYCSGLTELNLSNWNTSNVTDMGSMYNDCSSLKSLNLSSFDTSKVTDMGYMFSGCTNLTSLDLSNWNTSNVTDMTNMFGNCKSLISLDLNSFDTSKVTSMYQMFNRCSNLTSITLSNAHKNERLIQNNYSSLRTACTKIYVDTEETIKIKFINATSQIESYITNGTFIINNTEGVYDEENGYWVFTYVAKQPKYPIYYNSVEIGYCKHTDRLQTIKITNENEYYNRKYDCTITIPITSTYETYYVICRYTPSNTYTTPSNGCISNMYIDDIETSVYSSKTFSSIGEHKISFDFVDQGRGLTSMSNMFSGCSQITNIEFGYSFDTSNVTSMSYMVYSCSGLKSIDMYYVNANKVTSVQYLLNNCSSINYFRFGGNLINCRIYDSITYNANNLSSCNLIYKYNNGFDKIINNSNFSNWSKLCISCKPISISLYEDNVLITDVTKYSSVRVGDVELSFNSETNMWEGEVFAEDMYYPLYVNDELHAYKVKMIEQYHNIYFGSISDIASFSLKYVPSSTTNATYLFNTSYTQYVDIIMVDGKQISPSNTYTFTDTNEHNVEIVFDMSRMTSFSNLFSETYQLSECNIGDNLDTSKVTDMSYMFNECNGLTELNLSSFDTSKVTDMNQMFQNCNGLTSLNLSNFDTSKVTSMRYMFGNCNGLTSITFSNLFDTSNVTTMYCMFRGCNGLTSLNLNNFNTSNVTSMESMFNDCSGLTSLDLNSFNTSKVTNMSYMFHNCNKLTSLDLNLFDTSNVTNMAEMFASATSLTSLTMNSEVSNVTATTNMFSGITTNGTFTHPCMYDYELITNQLPTSWTKNCVSVANVTLNFVIIDNNIEVTEGTVIVNDIEATYSSENGYWSVIYTIDEPYSDVMLNGTNIGIITNGKYNNLQHILIGDCSNYVDISATYTATSANQIISLFSGPTTTSGFNLSNIESIYVDGKMITPRSSYTFTTVGEHDVKYFVKDSITTMSFYYAFYNNHYLTKIKFGNRFNNENSVSTLESAFNSCYRLQFANLSNISMSANTSNEQLYSGFTYCTALTSVYLPQNIDDIGDYCFYNCSGLTSINIPNSVKYIGYSAFTNCYRLSEIRIPSSVTSIDTACFAYCSGATSLVFEEGCQLKTIPSSGFMNCDSLTTITIPEGITTINTSAFYSCNNIKTITLPSTLTSIGTSGFSSCDLALTEIYSYAKTAPNISNSTFRSVKSNGTLHIPTNADYSTWLSTSSYYLGYYSWNSTIIYIPTACTSLNITALDVKGKATSTTISYTAVTNGVDSEGTEVTNVTMTGTVESAPFEQNTDTANTVTRIITFEYLGMTARTEITQSVWVDQEYSINLNNQWQLSTAVSNPDSSLYDGVYESFANKGVNNSADICIITIKGYENFTLYVRSYAESKYDYVVVSNLDCILNSETTSGTNVKMTTSGNQQSNTAITAYTKVEFTNIDGGEHTIQVMYRKDSSQNHNDDRGYLLIPKEQ